MEHNSFLSKNNNLNESEMWKTPYCSYLKVNAISQKFETFNEYTTINLAKQRSIK